MWIKESRIKMHATSHTDGIHATNINLTQNGTPAHERQRGRFILLPKRKEV
jgi:hypothetical protein